MINHRLNWTTLDELRFLGLAFHQRQDPSTIIGYFTVNGSEKRRLKLLKSYRAHMGERKTWGHVNPDLIREPLNEEIRRLEETL